FAAAAGPAAWRRCAAGAAVGAAAGALGLYANRLLFIADALRAIGRPAAGGLLLYATPLLLAGATAVLVLLAFRLRDHGAALRIGAACLLFSAGATTAELSESYLRAQWDFGQPSLAAAAGIPPGADARTAGIMILADQEGRPGSRYREVVLAAGGVDVSTRSLTALRGYLADTRYRTVHLRAALTALRAGAALNWDAELLLDAAMIRIEPGFPPDTLGFLEAVGVAPATTENYGRLEQMGRYAWHDRIPDIKSAQKTFVGFSTAYARFGELETSNLWLDRIRGLWPLYEDDIHVEPLQTNHDGRIAGTLRRGAAPARDIRVGLFAAPSTTTVLDAARYLVASVRPGEDGRFEFLRLLPGRYYLALRGDAEVLGGRDLMVHGANGMIQLTALEMDKELSPIMLDRRRPAVVDGLPVDPAALPGMAPQSGEE
ncbi:MAG: hypothetical protein ABIJ96_08635, partial [Elusimicrobiota bacterium]